MTSMYLLDSEIRALVRRADLTPVLLRRKIEEDIVSIVNPSLEPSDSQWDEFYKKNSLEPDDSQSLNSWLNRRGWEKNDLCLDLILDQSLKLFMEQRYGPGIEDRFLECKNDLDIVIYSLLRVKDPGLAREIWISLSEGEVTFADVAAVYSDGPEAKTKGVIGPLALGRIEPLVAERLRSLRVGDLRPPEALGDWHVLLRLESLQPSQLDTQTRQRLLQEQFDVWIKKRVDVILSGETPEPIHYDLEA